MTNERKQIALFLQKYPQFEGRNLSLNLYSDILDMDKPVEDRIIAKSNLKHNLMEVGYDLATDWKLL